MKKIVTAIVILLLLAACSGDDQDYDDQDYNETYNQRAGNTSEPTAQVPCPAPTQVPEWTIGELAETIVSVGELWEDWWRLQGVFSWQYFEAENYELPDDLHLRGFSRLQPLYGLSDLEDVRRLLSEFYTEDWINAFLESESVFIEHEGALLIHTARYGTLRPNWETATHSLIEENLHQLTVETSVTAYDHRGSGD